MWNLFFKKYTQSLVGLILINLLFLTRKKISYKVHDETLRYKELSNNKMSSSDYCNMWVTVLDLFLFIYFDLFGVFKAQHPLLN